MNTMREHGGRAPRGVQFLSPAGGDWEGQRPPEVQGLVVTKRHNGRFDRNRPACPILRKGASGNTRGLGECIRMPDILYSGSHSVEDQFYICSYVSYSASAVRRCTTSNSRCSSLATVVVLALDVIVLLQLPLHV